MRNVNGLSYDMINDEGNDLKRLGNTAIEVSKYKYGEQKLCIIRTNSHFRLHFIGSNILRIVSSIIMIQFITCTIRCTWFR